MKRYEKNVQKQFPGEIKHGKITSEGHKRIGSGDYYLEGINEKFVHFISNHRRGRIF